MTGNLANNGSVTPGDAPGILTIKGAYTQGASGALNLEVGGTLPGSGFDQLIVTGNAALAGTLNISFINGYGQAAGQIYNVFDAGSVTGSFGTVNQPASGGSPAFLVQTAASSVNLVGTTSAADLAVQSISFSPTTVALGQNIQVTLQVTNRGTTTATGNWNDSIYLAVGPTLSANDLLLGRVTHSGDVAGLSTYTETLTAPIPGLVDGTYRIIVVADSGKQVPDLGRSNNVVTATAPLAIRSQVQPSATPFSGTIADGQDLYYRINVPPGANVQVSASFAVALEADVYVSFGAMPTRSIFDLSGGDPSSTNQLIMLPPGQGGTYYVLLHGREGAGSGQPFSFRNDPEPFQVTQIDTISGGNQGQSTIGVTGAGFTPNTTVNLHNATNQVAASQVLLGDANHLTATFDLTGIPTGSYTLEVDDSGHSATASTPFQVTAPGLSPPVIQTVIMVPSQGRVGLPISPNIQITNYGESDAFLPVLQLTGTDTNPYSQTDSPSVLKGGHAIGNGPNPINYHTASFSATFYPHPSGPHQTHGFNIGSAPASAPLDWSSVEEQDEPPTIPPAVWSIIFGNFVAAVGHTAGSLQAVLLADQTYFANLGTPITDTQTLIDFELQKASALGPVPTLASTVDVAVPEPGLPLTFSRTFVQGIAGRNQLNALGDGWISNWDISLETDTVTGNVIIQDGAATRIFIPQKDGTCSGTGADHAVLTDKNGIPTLTELDGSVTTFLSDGRLNFVEDRDGNRITAIYASPFLTLLAHSDGDVMQLAYDANGRITSVTDPVGRTVSYSYDGSDTHLLAVTAPIGTYRYSYVTGQGAARENALASAPVP